MSEEIPILNINISGDYPVGKLKEYGEYIKLTWTELGCNQMAGCHRFEVFAHIDNTKILSAYHDGRWMAAELAQ